MDFSLVERDVILVRDIYKSPVASEINIDEVFSDAIVAELKNESYFELSTLNTYSPNSFDRQMDSFYVRMLLSINEFDIDVIIKNISYEIKKLILYTIQKKLFEAASSTRMESKTLLFDDTSFKNVVNNRQYIDNIYYKVGRDYVWHVSKSCYTDICRLKDASGKYVVDTNSIQYNQLFNRDIFYWNADIFEFKQDTTSGLTVLDDTNSIIFLAPIPVYNISIPRNIQLTKKEMSQHHTLYEFEVKRIKINHSDSPSAVFAFTL